MTVTPLRSVPHKKKKPHYPCVFRLCRLPHLIRCINRGVPGRACPRSCPAGNPAFFPPFSSRGMPSLLHVLRSGSHDICHKISFGSIPRDQQLHKIVSHPGQRRRPLVHNCSVQSRLPGRLRSYWTSCLFCAMFIVAQRASVPKSTDVLTWSPHNILRSSF